jgi:predicted amidohydrolase
MRIAVVQFRITHLDKAENFRRIEEFVRQATRERTDIIVFPEDCITGSIFGDLSRLDMTGEARSFFQRIAKEHRIDIVTGSCMEGTSEGNFNTSYYVDATGNVLGTYRKNHLYPSEYKFLSPGTDAPVFGTAYGRAGIVICWDMLFPEIFQRMKAQGVLACTPYTRQTFSICPMI